MNNTDKIIMKGLQFYAYHGALPQEQELGQKFIIDIEMFLNLQPAGSTDKLKKTIDYATVYNLVHQIVTGQKYKLIEALAENIAAIIIDKFPVLKVQVQVKKPQAPVAGSFDYLAVAIERQN